MRAAVAATVPPPLAALAAAAKLCEPHVPPCCCVRDAGLGEGDAAREDAFQSCFDSSSSSSVPHAGLFPVVGILDGVFVSAPALVTRSFSRSRSSARTRAFSSRWPFSHLRARHALIVPSNARSPSAPTTPLSLLRQSQRRHLPGCVRDICSAAASQHRWSLRSQLRRGQRCYPEMQRTRQNAKIEL